MAAFSHRIDKHIKGLQVGLHAGDEATKPLFIQQVIEPTFDQLASFGAPVAEKITSYRAALDPEMQTIYRSRRDFEESLKLINETIATYLDQEEARAQEYFPHYFEKLKTDGVEHTIYIGASMVQNSNFSPMYLKSVRLWQLMVICEVVRRTRKSKEVCLSLWKVRTLFWPKIHRSPSSSVQMSGTSKWRGLTTSAMRSLKNALIRR